MQLSKYIILLLAVISLGPAPAGAAMPPLDATAIGKLTDRLSKLQEQINKLTEMSTRLQKRIDAIGNRGRASLLVLDIDRLGSRLSQDIHCLKPHFSMLTQRREVRP